MIRWFLDKMDEPKGFNEKQEKPPKSKRSFKLNRPTQALLFILGLFFVIFMTGHILRWSAVKSNGGLVIRTSVVKKHLDDGHYLITPEIRRKGHNWWLQYKDITTYTTNDAIWPFVKSQTVRHDDGLWWYKNE